MPHRTADLPEGAPIGRNWSGLEGRDRGSMPAELSAKLLPLGRVIRVERRLEAAGRGGGSPGTDVCVDLPGSAGLIFIVPEVHVVLAFHRLDAEATPDLHATG